VVTRFHLQQATEGDRQFLFELHCATMRDYIARTWGWDEGWQRNHFDTHFHPASRQLIVVDGEPVGMLQIERKPDELFIANIQVAPRRQGQGIGSAVICQIMDDAKRSGLPTTLQVLQVNERARRLY
jgi:ribosomal protein S18 acetylase RimI-like enzyme